VVRGFFPLDEQLHLGDLHWSEAVARQAVWLGGLVSFGDAAMILQEVGQIAISKSSVWRLKERWGARFQERERKRTEIANRLPGQEQNVVGEMSGQARLGVSMDGAMVYVLGEEWKELKVGTVFKVEPHTVLDKTTLEEETYGRSTQASYVAHLGGPETFGRLLWAEAQQRAWDRAADTQVIGDGAVWIWNLTTEHFYDSHQTVDWYHGTEHLAKAAEYLYGTKLLARRRWLNEQKQTLFQGHADKIVTILRNQADMLSDEKKENLLKEATYFKNNKRRMNYLDMRSEGWLIGSGTVESAAKQYKARFTGPGMRWKRPCLERLIPIRSAVMTGNFNSLWHSIYHNSPLN
jgi:hypothetical protein